MAKGGVITYLDHAHSTAHNKVMMIDGKTIMTGSFNFTNAAQERNAEDVLILDAPALATEYTKNWKIHQKRSELYKIENRRSCGDEH